MKKRTGGTEPPHLLSLFYEGIIMARVTELLRIGNEISGKGLGLCGVHSRSHLSLTKKYGRVWILLNYARRRAP